MCQCPMSNIIIDLTLLIWLYQINDLPILGQITDLTVSLSMGKSGSSIPNMGSLGPQFTSRIRAFDCGTNVGDLE